MPPHPVNSNSRVLKPPSATPQPQQQQQQQLPRQPANPKPKRKKPRPGQKQTTLEAGGAGGAAASGAATFPGASAAASRRTATASTATTTGQGRGGVPQDAPGLRIREIVAGGAGKKSRTAGRPGDAAAPGENQLPGDEAAIGNSPASTPTPADHIETSKARPDTSQACPPSASTSYHQCARRTKEAVGIVLPSSGGGSRKATLAAERSSPSTHSTPTPTSGRRWVDTEGTFRTQM